MQLNPLQLNKLFTVFLLLACSAFANAELVIEITQGNNNPTRIAIVPFAKSGFELTEDVAEIVQNDLHRSGMFEPLDRSGMLSRPTHKKDVFYRDWRALGVDYLVIGRVTQRESDKPVNVYYELFDVIAQKSILKEEVNGKLPQQRDLAHYISDRVYEKLTGEKGAFSTRILYVSAKNLPNQKYSYRLYLADVDGARPVKILDSEEPILSPTWSPDGKQIAYVSFENGRPSIWRQVLASGKREKLTNFPGLNSAPSWSPDGKKMAMVLSKDGNPEIYVLDMQTRQFTRITNNRLAIDTEPGWTPDGQGLIFTSNRGGNPQIYLVSLANPSAVRRLTPFGSYNARARMLADGKHIVLVHRSNGQYHIALLNIENQRMLSLTETSLDESPTVAPNGTMVLYATQRNGRGILGAVSVDGDVKFSLPSATRDVREPAWSPFL